MTVTGDERLKMIKLPHRIIAKSEQRPINMTTACRNSHQYSHRLRFNFSLLPLLLILLSSFCALSAAIDRQPRFLATTDSKHVHLEGDTVRMPCPVENLGGNTGVLWRRTGGAGEGLIYAITNRMTDDDRFRLEHPDEHTWDLFIRGVEPFDSGEYVCEITTDPPKKLYHQLVVQVPPSISLKPEGSPHSVEPGEQVSLQCIGAGNPVPNVTWRRVDGGLLPNGRQEFEGSRLVIKSANHGDTAGVYECRADNGVGTPATASIELQIHSSSGNTENAPWLEAVASYVPANVGADVNLTCMYNGSPPPQVHWLFNGYAVSTSGDSKMEQMAARRSNFSETILAIHEVTLGNFGDYVCRVSNNRGTRESSIHLSGKPGAPEVHLEGSGATKIFVAWKTESPNEIKQYQIKYRPASEEAWLIKPVDARNVDLRRAKEYESRYTLEGLKPNTLYHIMVQARNQYGWGGLPQNYAQMATAKEETKAEGKPAQRKSDIADNKSANSDKAVGSAYLTVASLSLCAFLTALSVFLSKCDRC